MQTKPGAWRILFSRRWNLHNNSLLFVKYWSGLFYSKYGVGLTRLIAFSEGANQSMYGDPIEYERLVEVIYKKLIEEKQLEAGISGAMENFKQVLRYASGLAEKNLGGLNNEQLASLYAEYLEKNIEQLFSFFTEPVFLDERLADEVRTGLGQEFLPAAVQGLLEIVSVPLKDTWVMRERIDLLKIAAAIQEKRGEKEIEKMCEEHARKYCWLPCYVEDIPPFDGAHFLEEAKKMAADFDAARELETMSGKVFEARERFRELKRELGNNQRLLYLVEAMNEISWFRDERDQYRRMFYFYGSSLFKEIAARAGLSLRDVCMLSFQEIQDFLLHKKILSRKELAERRKGYAVVFEAGELRVLTGVAQEKLREQILGKEKEFTQVCGIVGCAGDARGMVVLIRHRSDLNKVVKGSVLVAVTTNPDYVQAMRKAAAIVTDQGGITSHAAIVARELGIPCIVGTMHATRIFRDGDLVEVNAEKGVVKKL
jgi:phosphohistidine swiveling domain-containing protein